MTLELSIILCLIWLVVYNVGTELTKLVLKIILQLAWYGMLIYVIIHFIHKYW